MRGLELLLLSILISSASLAQTSDIRFYDQSRGLSQHSVSAIVQDHKGFLWVGTRHGLNRYDGKEFHSYESPTGQGQSLSNSTIQSMLVDNQGNIWIGTYGGGLNVYDYQRDQFKHYKQGHSIDSLSSNFAMSVFQDSRGKIWVGTENGGVNVFDIKTGVFQRYLSNGADPFSVSSNNITAINEDVRGNIWIGTWGGGINFFDSNSKRFIKFHEDPNADANIVRNIYQTKNGDLFFGTHKGLKKLHYTNNAYSFSENLTSSIQMDESLSDVRVLSMAEDQNGNLWIGTENEGLFYLNTKTGKATQYLRNKKEPTALPSNSIWSLMVDNFGTVWIGSYDKGLCKIDPYEEKFTSIFRNNPFTNSLSHDVVSAFAEDDQGNFWIGTDGGGLNYFNVETTSFQHFKHNPDDPASLGNDAVVSLALDDDGTLWVGTWEGGVSILKKGENKFKRLVSLPDETESLSGNDIHKVYKDSKNRIWIGAFRAGLDMYDINTGKFYHYRFEQDAPSKQISGDKIRTVIEDFQGRIWVGTEGAGLDCITLNADNTLRLVENYRNVPGDSNSLSNNTVIHLFEDHDKILWVGTEGGGLNKFNITNNNFDVIAMKDGLPSDVIYGIQEDKNGSLWISTNRGLVQYEIEKGLLHLYDELDGLQSEAFYKAASYQARSGLLLFGGIRGFNIFNPYNVKRNPNAPSVYITSASLSGEPLVPCDDCPLKRSIIETDELVLDYDQNDLSFSFAALNYSQSLKNKFEFRLKNYDEKWQNAGEQNTATYANIPPGNYIFQVRGSNNDDVWNTTPKELKIIINEPWYKTTWAYGFYMITMMLILLVSRDNIIKRERLKSELQLEHMELTKTQELSKLKSRFFANISHEFRTPLTLIIGPLINLYQNLTPGPEKKKAKMMIRNAEQLLGLINQVQDLSKLESGSMKLRATANDIVKFIRTVAYPFTSFADKKYINYKTDLPKKEILVFFEKEKLEKVFNNLIINAFKFTPEFGSITIGLIETENGVSVFVEDSGPGIPNNEIDQIFNRFFQGNTSKTGTGIGLSLAKELVELHKGTISVKSEVGQGTTFTIFLPLGSAHLLPHEVGVPASNGTDAPAFMQAELSKISLLEEDDAIENEADEVESIDNTPLLLVVDDNPEMLGFVVETLSTAYRISTAVNGLEAIKIARTQIPDLIVTDVMMPEMDGYQFCEALKNDQKTSHIPVIMLTAKASTDSELKGFETGAIHYITKPFNPSLLLIRVKNIFQSQALLKERILNNQTLNLDPKHVVIASADEDFLKNVVTCIEQHMEDSDFQVDTLCKEVGIGRMQLYRKLKGLIGLSANEFIRSIRLKRAAQLIQQQKLTIAEVTYRVGFNDLHYFRQCFKKQFGVNPSEYVPEEPLPENAKKNVE